MGDLWPVPALVLLACALATHWGKRSWRRNRSLMCPRCGVFLAPPEERGDWDRLTAEHMEASHDECRFCGPVEKCVCNAWYRGEVPI